MISGELVVTYTDGTEEICAANDLFYWPPGHNVKVDGYYTLPVKGVGYFLFGAAFAVPHTAIAGVVPSLDSLRELMLGSVEGWKRFITTAPPMGVWSMALASRLSTDWPAARRAFALAFVR